MPNTSLDALFRPRSVAVIGASRRRGTVGAEVFHNMMAGGFPGPVYPVHSVARAVQSVRAYPSVVEIPDEIDLAVIVVPSRHVGEVVDACAVKGVRALVVISAGFAEVGEHGRVLQRQVLERVRERGMRMVGPNCLGILNADPAVRLNATFGPTWPPTGNVAVASQSGAVGLALLDYARKLGIGISHFASTGNKADVSGNDLLEYWEHHESTRVIVLYLESFGNPGRFMQIARRVSRVKPILVVKSGRTEAGARAATSHTGVLAGMDVAVDALLGQAGVIRTDTMQELFDLAMLLANQTVPAGRRVAVLTNGGGPGIMAADACESRGLVIPELSAATQDALGQFLPAEASVANPVDMIASAPAEAYEKAISLLLADPSIDALLVLFVPVMVTAAQSVATHVCRAAAGATKPVVTCLLGTHGVPAAQDMLREHQVPTYDFPESAVLALSRAARYGEWLRREPGTAPELHEVAPAQARAVIGECESGWLAPDRVRAILAAYGLRVPRMELVRDPTQLIDAAERVGYPLALKLLSRRVIHKTDVGGVFLGLSGPDDLGRARDTMAANLASRNLSSEHEGFILQEMVPGGVEMYVGMTQAPGFGALLAFGSGGVSVELWKDVVFRVHPLTSQDAWDMLDQIRGTPLLDGFRGAPPADKAALVDAILRVDRLVGDIPEVLEMDINPLLAWPPGQGVVALDARIRVGTPRT